MRLFRRARDTKTSAIRRGGVSSRADAATVSEAQAEDRHSESRIARVPFIPPPPPSYERLEESDVFLSPMLHAKKLAVISGVTRAASATLTSRRAADALANANDEEGERMAANPIVTLFVYGWDNVEPGPLSWVFPSLRAALDAVQKMRNAIGWCVVSGDRWSDLDAARAAKAVLVEQG